LGRAVQVIAIGLFAAATLPGGSPRAIGDEQVLEEARTAFVRLYHEPVTSAREGQDVPIRACVSGEEENIMVTLAYRPGGGALYETVSMEPAGFGCFEAPIPGAFVVRGTVEYYIRGDAGTGSPPAYAGHPNEPIGIEITGTRGRSGSERRTTKVVHRSGGGNEVQPPESDPPRSGAYGWRALILVLVGLGAVSYAILRPRLKARRTT
jgi:hypothetical protein